MASPSPRLLAVLLCSLVLSGCQLAAQPSSVTGQLPTYDPGGFCSLAALLPATVHVDPSADPPTWIDGPDGGHGLNLEWPVGFTLRTTDGMTEVADPDGNVVVQDGGQLTNAGGGNSARGDGWFSVCIINGRVYTSLASRLRRGGQSATAVSPVTTRFALSAHRPPAGIQVRHRCLAQWPLCVTGQMPS